MHELVRLRRLAADAIAWPVETAALPDVSAIVERVRRVGDDALVDFALKFGDPAPRRIAREEQRAAYESLAEDIREALNGAAERIAVFARAQRTSVSDMEIEQGGVRMGQRIRPIARVGAYAPGGRYPLPSSVLMCVIPARIAGVENISICSPKATVETLAAAYVANVDDFFEVGGAQAIAALAYGTKLIPRVDIIVGPGNAYVTAAKRAVYGDCGIDGLAGPSELAIIASADANSKFIAADLLAQAEHDPSARVMFLSEDAQLIERVEYEIEEQLLTLTTAAVARTALATNGCAALIPLQEAIAVTNRLAPEHLSLQGSSAELLAGVAENYGSLFVGAQTAEVFGDYGIGPNHVLPTNGTARFASGLSVFTFLTFRTYERASGSIDSSVIEQTATLAECEGLDGHRQSALRRAAG